MQQVKLFVLHQAELKAIVIIDKKIKEIICDKFKLLILLVEIICATTRIKKVLQIQLAGNGKYKKSSHLFAPLTSTPRNGTNSNNNTKNINIGIRLLLIKSVFKVEIIIIIKNEVHAYIRCFWKKK